jgi:hypothetical protein
MGGVLNLKKWRTNMGKVTVIFVRGSTDNIVDKVINDVSHGDYSHVAIKFDWGVIEALGVKDPSDKYPGVWLHSVDKYNNADVKLVDVDLSDLPAAEDEARRLIGTLYGYTDCIRGGIYDLTGVKLPGNVLTANCSETVTRILRDGGLNILPGIDADCVTPNDLCRALEAQYGQNIA